MKLSYICISNLSTKDFSSLPEHLQHDVLQYWKSQHALLMQNTLCIFNDILPILFNFEIISPKYYIMFTKIKWKLNINKK